MLEFDDIHRLVMADKRLPEHSAPEERMAYYELAGISERLGKMLITKNEATAQKAAVRKRFNDRRKARLLNLEAYVSYQNNIKAAESRISELLKSISPGADFGKLLRDALGIISLFEGQTPGVYERIFDGKMKESA